MRRREQREKLKTKNQILRQFLATYLIVFLVPLLMCSVYFFRIIGMLGSDDFDLRQRELEHSAEQMDGMIKEFESMGDMLTANNYVNSMKYRGMEVWENPNTYRLNELRDALPAIMLMNQNVYNYFIFFDKSELVINDKDIYTWEDFYQLYLHSEEYSSFEEWKQDMMNTSMTYGVKEEQTYDYRNIGKKHLLCFTRPLSLGEGATHAGIWILFEPDAVKNRMPALDTDSIQFIKNAEGELIYYAAGENITQEQEEVMSLVENASANPKLNGKRYHLMSSSSDKYGFTYSVLYADNVVKQRMVSVFMIAFLIVLCSILAGIVLSYLMSKKTVVPINDILSELAKVMEKSEDRQPVFTSLKNNFSYLVKRNVDLSAMIEDQKPYLRTAFVLRLLLGDIDTEGEAAKRAEYVGMEYRNKKFALLLFCFEMPWDEMDPELVTTCNLSLAEAVEKELPGSFHTGLGTNQTVLLMTLDPGEEETFRQKMEKHVERIKVQMPASISDHLFVYGSNVADHMTELKEAYRSSAGLNQYGVEQTEKAIYWYSPKKRERMVYPSGTLEAKLTSCVLYGDEKGLHDELERLMKNWVLGGNLSSYLQQMMFGELQLILLRILDRLDAEEEELQPFYDGLEKNMGMPLISQIQITLNLYRDLCIFVKGRRQEQDVEGLMTEVMKFIEVNYADSTLSLTQAASLYNVSESYLSTVFKNMQGIKFSSYVENVRISRAKELLEDTGLSVKEIAEQIGYTSANSFCRAFRRVTGMNTSEFRKK